ncbi:hypothetical protein BDR05DRAFT_992767 [Suillus weaverae]|nr:hypothetical protein BDR05DRAFT_992767 [Suillus weaverae]
MEPTKQTLLIGGLLVDVYSHPGATSSSTDQNPTTDSDIPIHALFFLHGRTESAQYKYVVDIAKVIFDESYSSLGGGERKKDLIIVAFGARDDGGNHGKRLVDQQRNLAWGEDPAKKNDQHAYVAAA